ncbi:peptidase C13 [Dyella acidiphila]|uniref:Peptidase C13 n=1 Tax=Dyella acidiphila TaxID=2775866 RepID=A0ABR9G5V5_9GAMM|nr:peptidase C13 [Dyella acidiphila]MBE1159434.1 peptidase C13 [Dyella acidiphila]
MLTVIALALLAGAQPAAAGDTFAERVQRAKQLETTDGGPAYQKQFWNKTRQPMIDTLRGCITSNAPADKSPFTLVADITPDGHPLKVEVRSPTPVARCLAGQFSLWIFPAPPKTSGSIDYPIEIDVSM